MGNTGPAFSKSLSTLEGKLQVSFGTPCSGRGIRHTQWLAAQPGSPFSHSHICKDSRAWLETLSGPTAWGAQEELSLVLKPAKNSRHSHSCHGSFPAASVSPLWLLGFWVCPCPGPCLCCYSPLPLHSCVSCLFSQCFACNLDMKCSLKS